MQPSLSVTIPWREADEEAYLDALQGLPETDGRALDALSDAGRFMFSIHLVPAHDSACTLPDATRAARCALREIYAGTRVHARRGTMSRPSDQPRIRLTFTPA